MKKRIRFKKSFWVLIFVLAVGIIGIVGVVKYQNHINSFEYLLSKKGYTEEEIKKAISNREIVNTLLEQDYNQYIIDIMNTKYYLSKNLDKYITYKTKYSDTSYEDVIAIVNVNADVDWYSKTNEVDLTKGNLILLNKFHYLNEEYNPEDLVDMSLMYAFTGKKLRSEAYDAFKSMVNAAKLEGLTIVANSAFRTYSYQEKTYNSIKASNGKAYADNYAARPGFSEHQTGLAVDVSTLNSTMENFEDTEEFKWLQENAQDYGFILRYPKNKEFLTGYNYESWHYRYVGVKVAKEIKKENITFDEYYAYYLE